MRQNRRKPQLSITIDKDVVEELDKVCEKEDRSRSYMINKILRNALKLDKDKRGK